MLFYALTVRLIPRKMFAMAIVNHFNGNFDKLSTTSCAQLFDELSADVVKDEV